MCPAEDDTAGAASWRLHVTNKMKIFTDRAEAAEAGVDDGPPPNTYEELMSLENVAKACAHLPVARFADNLVESVDDKAPEDSS